MHNEMYEPHIVVCSVSAELDRRHFAEALENQRFDSIENFRKYCSELDERADEENVLIFDLDSFMEAVNDQEIDNLTDSWITYVYMPNVYDVWKIPYIKKVLKEWGNTSCCERERDHSPSLMSIGNGKNNVSELVEQFTPNGVSTVVYNDEIEIGWNDYSYEELPPDVIDEIVEIMQEYEADMEKTMKRCED